MFGISELMLIKDALDFTIREKVNVKYEKELLIEVEKQIDDYFEEMNSL
ncbi:TPA: hypothetical protein LA460_000321 [Clostridium botulinum]|nr:hypothetical protein [Clostridium botulinum]HBJ1652925.1 hypothetical protein [Clostridium botulinum]